MNTDKSTHSKHHFVPEFYLNAWATSDESQAPRLTYFQWIQGRLHTTRIAPKGAAYQTDLYAGVDKDGRKNQSVEKEYFGPKVDDPAAPVIAKMIAGGQPLSELETEAFARYVLAQRVRTPGYVTHVRQEATLAIDEMAAGLTADYEAIRGQELPASPGEFIQQHMPHLKHYLGIQSLPRLIEQPALLASVLELEWGWGRIESSDRSLLTSDRPIVVTKGLGKPDCIIALPLSPTVAVFAMRDPEKLRRLLNQPARELIGRLNVHVVTQARTFVYARDNFQRSFVEKYFKSPDKQDAETFRRLRP